VGRDRVTRLIEISGWLRGQRQADAYTWPTDVHERALVKRLVVGSNDTGDSEGQMVGFARKAAWSRNLAL